MDRILAISDREQPFVPDYRPAYHYQVPLQFIPGLGRKKLDQLLDQFGTEMDILHRTSQVDLANFIGEDIATYIVQARTGILAMEVGGGGQYGKVKTLPPSMKS